jgi:hypothetical protein
MQRCRLFLSLPLIPHARFLSSVQFRASSLLTVQLKAASIATAAVSSTCVHPAPTASATASSSWGCPSLTPSPCSSLHTPECIRSVHSSPSIPSVQISGPSSGSSRPANSTRYACVVEYDGSQYHGWSPAAERPREKSVAGAIELAVRPLLGVSSAEHSPSVAVVGSGRTDKGVHGELPLDSHTIARSFHSVLLKGVSCSTSMHHCAITFSAWPALGQVCHIDVLRGTGLKEISAVKVSLLSSPCCANGEQPAHFLVKVLALCLPSFSLL